MNHATWIRVVLEILREGERGGGRKRRRRRR
jgi:hypothetical protein